MKCRAVLLCALLLGLGCAAERDRASWDEFWKDVNGENMQMRGFAGMNSSGERASRNKPQSRTTEDPLPDR